MLELGIFPALMPRFRYTAIDSEGRESAGWLEAAAAESVAQSLKARGVFPTSVEPAGLEVSPGPAAPRVGSSAGWNLSFGSGVGGRERANFTRQLGVLLRAGMPLVRGLEVLARQERNAALAKIVTALADAVRGGGTFSDALARHPQVFDRLYVNMLKAGEAGGALATVLERLATFQEKSLALRAKIRAAMFYPVVVLAVALSVLAGLLVFVVPKFQQIFADLLKGAPLPPLTRVVLGVSHLVQSNFSLVAGVAVALWLAFKFFQKTPAGGRLFDGLLLRLPVFGELVRKTVIARFSRTFGTLLSSGVPILPALLITRDTCGNTSVADAISAVHDQVKQGAPVARPLEATAVFPPMVTSMIEVGEHTGQLPRMLDQIADIYDAEVDTAVAGLSSLIEPVLIVFLALVVGTIVIALFLPIVRIVQLLS
jgi:type IV pilus assembly protein PilC